MAIQRESVELVHCCHGRSLINRFLKDASSITESFCLKVFRCFGQPLFHALGARCSNGATELFADLTGQIDRSRVAATRTSA